MKKQLLGAAGILAAGLVVGSAISITSANAADTSANPVASSTDANSGSTTTPPIFGGKDAPDMFSATPVRDDEKAVTADESAKLIAAAEAKVPGATVIRAETDGDGSAYEVHMKKADGSVLTVKFDSNFNVTTTEDGFGPGPKGGHGPDNDGDGPNGFQVPSTGSTGSTTQNG